MKIWILCQFLLQGTQRSLQKHFLVNKIHCTGVIRHFLRHESHGKCMSIGKRVVSKDQWRIQYTLRSCKSSMTRCIGTLITSWGGSPTYKLIHLNYICLLIMIFFSNMWGTELFSRDLQFVFLTLHVRPENILKFELHFINILCNSTINLLLCKTFECGWQIVREMYLIRSVSELFSTSTTSF